MKGNILGHSRMPHGRGALPMPLGVSRRLRSAIGFAIVLEVPVFLALLRRASGRIHRSLRHTRAWRFFDPIDPDGEAASPEAWLKLRAPTFSAVTGEGRGGPVAEFSPRCGENCGSAQQGSAVAEIPVTWPLLARAGPPIPPFLAR